MPSPREDLPRQIADPLNLDPGQRKACSRAGLFDGEQRPAIQVSRSFDEAREKLDAR